ncbi:hypothetical protein Peur_027758 [Populus x canadensis]
MAEAGVLETMPRTMTKETELKKELEKLVKTILVEEDYRVEVTDEAMRILSVLKELKFKKSSKVVEVTMTKETELKKELEKLVKTILVEEDYRVEVTDEAMKILSVLKELKFKKSSKVVEVTMTKETELKKELEKLVKTILVEEDYRVEVTDEAMRILSVLKELKFKKSSTVVEVTMTKETELKKELEKLVKTILVEEDYRVEVTDEAMRILSVLKEMKFKKSLKVVEVTMTKETELKKELEKLVKTILVEEDYRVEVTDEAMRILSVLKELKFEKFSKVVDNTVIPEEFICPISKKIMNDPVVLATGQTYDRPFIQRLLNEGHRTCPQTQQVISHTFLTPNHLVQEMISKWCMERGIELPKPLVDDDVHTDADRVYLKSLLEKMSSSLSDQKEAAKELRRLTKRMRSFRSLFSDSTDAISQLLNPLSSGRANTHPDLLEDLITTIFNLSIHENNKQLFAENPHVIPLLVESVRSGTIETRRNAAAALFSLSALDSNKLIIGKSGALEPLIGLLEEGHPPAMKDAALAIFNLCRVLENRVRAVQEGAVRVILKKIMDCILVDELLATLAILTSQQEAVEEMGLLGAVPCLIDIIRESSSERNKENCAAILHTICLNDHTKWRAIMEEEKANATLSILAENGTSRAKRKANGILKILNGAASIIHTL